MRRYSLETILQDLYAALVIPVVQYVLKKTEIKTRGLFFANVVFRLQPPAAKYTLLLFIIDKLIIPRP
jgi:hypothetical protein